MSRKRPDGADPRAQTQIRLDRDLLDRLHAEADARDLSVNFLIVAAIKDFLPRLIPAEELKLTRD